jgi:TonB-dependent starch-binding outer membrane protein SusC
MGYRSTGRLALAALALVAALGATVAPLAAQNAAGTVRGRVVESGTMRPLNGVQVSIPGTNRGALTNASGDFILVGVPAGTHTVRAQFVGFTPAERAVTVTAGETAQLEFQLAQAAIALDEVVVTGTAGGSQRRAIGNAVTTVQAAEVTERAPISTVTEILQARTPGLTVMQGSGTAGTASSFRIRGTGSLSAGNQPVFYVDGVRIQSGSQGGFGAGGQATSALNAINPEDIESIEVIKGPAAATLYGADAAAGVIQIITKRGRAGQQNTQWTARAEMGQTDWHLGHPTNFTTCTPARIRSAAWGGCAGMDSLGPVEQRILSDNPMVRDDVLRNGASHNLGLSVRGGGDRYSFYLSGDREGEEGVFENNFFNRTTGRANFSVLPSEQWDVTASAQYTRSDTRLPLNDNATNGWQRNAYRGLPGWTGAPYAPGWRGLGPEQINIYDNQERSERFILGVTANYQPTEWFRNRVTAGMDAGTRLHTLFYPIDRTGRQPFGASAAGGYISQYTPQTRNYTLDYTGTVSNDLSRDLNSALSFGMNLNLYRFESLQAVGEGLIADNVRLVNTANVTRAFESMSEQNQIGFYVQEQLGWRNRLFLTGALRVDDNSAFGENFSTVVYPKLSGSWVVSEEPFFNLAGVDNLRLRAAWGQAGNAPAPFSADRTYAASTVLLENGVLASALRADAFGNPDIRAERGSEIEVGFEGSFLDNRAGVDVTFYDKTTRDALIPVNVAPSSGFAGSVLQNVGTIHNRGLEVSVFGTPVRTRNVSWDTRLGLSTNRNELTSFGGRDEFIGVGYGGSQRHEQGYPLGGYWAQEPVRNDDGSLKLLASGRPELGEWSYIGSPVPTREVAFSNTVTLFGGLQLYAFADYKGGHYLYNMAGQVRHQDGNSWSANDPAASPESVMLGNWGGNMPWIERADFVKLREVSATYSLPTSWARRMGADGLSVSLAGRNLGLWTGYSGLDPEVNVQGDHPFIRADFYSTPPLRRVVASMNVRF